MGATTDLRFEAAVRAAAAKAPAGMGSFTLREIVRAALDAWDRRDQPPPPPPQAPFRKP